MNKPSAKTVDFSANPSPSVSSRTRILSSATWPGTICGYTDELAIQSRPCGSKFICVGLASNGDSAQRFTSNPGATSKDATDAPVLVGRAVPCAPLRESVDLNTAPSGLISNLCLTG